jgi:hypothetical protein
MRTRRLLCQVRLNKSCDSCLQTPPLCLYGCCQSVWIHLSHRSLRRRHVCEPPVATRRRHMRGVASACKLRGARRPQRLQLALLFARWRRRLGRRGCRRCRRRRRGGGGSVARGVSQRRAAHAQRGRDGVELCQARVEVALKRLASEVAARALCAVSGGRKVLCRLECI